MDIPFDQCPVTKQEAIEAINNLVKYFQSPKRDSEFFGLDDLGIIDIYIHFN